MENQYEILASLEEKIRCLPSVVPQEEVMDIISSLLGLVEAWKAQAESSMILLKESMDALQKMTSITEDNNELMRENIKLTDDLLGGQNGVSAKIIINKLSL